MGAEGRHRGVTPLGWAERLRCLWPIRRRASVPDEQRYSLDEIGEVHAAYFRGQGLAPGGPWDRYRHAHLVLPPWFHHDLDPWSATYAMQQRRLWSAITGVEREYDPAIDEREHAWPDMDAIRFPGYYRRRDPEAVVSAADHIIATGMLLKHGGLRPGDHALEYGAGFGQTALALARLGVVVDTVDISDTFCGFVQAQGDFFGVPLTAHAGRFGFNPRPGIRYRLIWFYESFHHCVDFLDVVPRLADHLADDGCILLAGEPIVEHPQPAVPYPWGLRLHSEAVAVMREHHWFELGFTESFLFELFRRAGFEASRIDCEPSPFGRLYSFRRSAPAPAGRP